MKKDTNITKLYKSVMWSQKYHKFYYLCKIQLFFMEWIEKTGLLPTKIPFVICINENKQDITFWMVESLQYSYYMAQRLQTAVTSYIYIYVYIYIYIYIYIFFFMGYTLWPPLGCWSLCYVFIWDHLVMVPRG